MLKPAVIFFAALVVLTGCTSLSSHPDTRPPVPRVWDMTRDDHPPGQTMPAPLPPAPAPPPQVDMVETNHFEDTWIGLDQWADESGFAPVERVPLVPLQMTITNGFQWNDLNLKARTALIPLPTFALHTTNGVLTIQPDTRTAYLDEIQLHLGFTPELVQGELLLHELDIHKTIAPLLQQPLMPATNRTLVIDPDDSAEAGDVPEDLQGAAFALDWAQRLASLLATNGWTVLLTRTNSDQVPPADRAAFADMHPASLFLNLCFSNAGTNSTPAGVDTYCLTPAGMPSNAPQNLPEENWHVFPNNAWDAKNWLYAFRIHRALIKIPGVKDHGLRRSRFIPMLLNRDYPAVSVSGGYVSNPRDAALVANAEFRQKLAEAVAAALQ